MNVGGSDSDAGDEPPSILSIIPGGSIVRRLPGSGLLLKGENILRSVVGTGLLWMMGGQVPLDPELDEEEHEEEEEEEEHEATQNYIELRSAVQDLIDLFEDEEVRSEPLNSADLLRATKTHISKLESQLFAEQQARRLAEARLQKLEQPDSSLMTRLSEKQRLEKHICDLKQMRIVDGNERELIADLQSQVASQLSFDSSDELSLDEGERYLHHLNADLDRERKLRDQAERKLREIRELHTERLREPSGRPQMDQTIYHLTGEEPEESNTKILA